jgi:hypothetical protein
MQLFILLYIEGGSYIQEDEDKWEFAVLSVAFILNLHRESNFIVDMNADRVTRKTLNPALSLHIPTISPDILPCILSGAGLTRFA